MCHSSTLNAYLAGVGKRLCRSPVAWAWRQLLLVLPGGPLLLQLLLGLLQPPLSLQMDTSTMTLCCQHFAIAACSNVLLLRVRLGLINNSLLSPLTQVVLGRRCGAKGAKTGQTAPSSAFCQPRPHLPQLLLHLLVLHGRQRNCCHTLMRFNIQLLKVHIKLRLPLLLLILILLLRTTVAATWCGPRIPKHAQGNQPHICRHSHARCWADSLQM